MSVDALLSYFREIVACQYRTVTYTYTPNFVLMLSVKYLLLRIDGINQQRIKLSKFEKSAKMLWINVLLYKRSATSS